MSNSKSSDSRLSRPAIPTVVTLGFWPHRPGHYIDLSDDTCAYIIDPTGAIKWHRHRTDDIIGPHYVAVGGEDSRFQFQPPAVDGPPLLYVRSFGTAHMIGAWFGSLALLVRWVAAANEELRLLRGRP